MTINNPNKEMQCVALDENGVQCGEPGRPSQMAGLRVVTCGEHYQEAFCSREAVAEGTYYLLERAGVIAKHTPGWTYVVRLNDGTVKIGTVTSDSERNLARRLRRVGKAYNEGIPVEVLALLKGGRSMELKAHGMWRPLRVTNKNGERFNETPELMAWIAEQGIDPSGKAVVEAHEEWRAEQLRRPQPVDLFADCDW